VAAEYVNNSPPSSQSLARRADHADNVPVIRVSLATEPISIDRRFRLDSAGSSPWARWSYQLASPSVLVQADATGHTVASSASGMIAAWPDPLAALRWMQQQLVEPPQEGPPFKGGWLGYLGYDLGRWFEVLPARRIEPSVPLMAFAFFDELLATDHHTGRIYHVRLSHGLPTQRLQPLDEPWPISSADSAAAGLPRSNFASRKVYEAAVARAIEYIAAGDIFQVNLSQRFSLPLTRPPAEVYDRLRHEFGAWFGGYLEWPRVALLCNSPELFLRVRCDNDGRRHVLTRPIKGTRPRGPGMEEALRRSPKDQAELNMIIDLERNDLGRICRTGSVQVTEPRVIEAHPTVYHGAATIEGQLEPAVGLVELLAATFPGGSITGAPKIRAMQIIDELEPTARGPYCGAIGFFSADGTVDLNIAIRTMIAAGGQVHVPVGGGIVADSLPAEEYEETLVKASALFGALRAAGCTR